jgi:hypothetical protein
VLGAPHTVEAGCTPGGVAANPNQPPTEGKQEMTTMIYPKPAPPSWAELANKFVSELEHEAAADCKAFYGNSVVESEGRQRLEAGLAAVAKLKARLEALNRGR